MSQKANALPQQLENLAKKQFAGGDGAGEKEAGAAATGAAVAGAGSEGGHAGATGSSEKDEEIATLRKQLAATKVKKGAGTAAAKHGAAGRGGAKLSREKKAQEVLGVGKGSHKQLKETRGLQALGAGTGIKTGAHGKKQFEAIGRRKSHSKAVRDGLPMLSTRSKPRKPTEEEALVVLLGAEAAAHEGHSKAKKSEKGHGSESSHSEAGESETGHGSEASHSKGGKSEKGYGSEASHSKAAKSEKVHGSEAGHSKAHGSTAGSAMSRSKSVSAHYTHAEKASKASHSTSKPKRSKSVKPPSDDDSDGSSTVMSLKGQDEHIRKHHYEPSQDGHAKASSVVSRHSKHSKAPSHHGSEQGSVAPSHSKHSKAPSHHGSEHGGAAPSMALVPAYGEGRRGVNGYKEASVYSYSGEAGEMYVVEVEEEPDLASMPKGGAVEVMHTKGRTLYVVKD